MKKPEYIKLPILIFCLLLVYAGFKMLPQQDEIRSSAHKLVITGFMRDFHKAEEVTNGQTLPKAELLSREGRKITLSEITKGRISIVNFWATWCAPCLEELPSLARLQEANEDILILPVSLDMQKKPDELAAYFDKEELRDLRWFHDQEGVLRKSLNLTVYPTTYVLDEKGEIIYILQGPTDWFSSRALDFIRVLSNKY